MPAYTTKRDEGVIQTVLVGAAKTRGPAMSLGGLAASYGWRQGRTRQVGGETHEWSPMS